MRIVRHPLVKRDLVEFVDHIVKETGGGFAALLDASTKLMT